MITVRQNTRPQSAKSGRDALVIKNKGVPECLPVDHLGRDPHKY